MDDRFKAQVPFAVADDDSAWIAAGYVASYIARTLRQTGRVYGPEFHLEARDGSELVRSSVTDLRRAAAEHHLTPARLFVFVRSKVSAEPTQDGDDSKPSGFKNDVRLRADCLALISVWLSGTMGNDLPSLNVVLESPDKLFLDGVKARLTAESQRGDGQGTWHLPVGSEAEPTLNAQIPVPLTSKVGASTGEPFRATEGHDPATAQVPPRGSDAVETPEYTRAWIRRTWRDHTAGVVVTVVGTLLATALAVYFGFGN
jgi:hypothetical protein